LLEKKASAGYVIEAIKVAEDFAKQNNEIDICDMVKR
jgi:hypothetical protein